MGDRPIITLLTDFGWGDGYIGAMKGVILQINPQCRIVDLAHEIPRHDVTGAALALGRTYPFFPSGTIHVAVVDPGGGRGPQTPGLGDGGLSLCRAGQRLLHLRAEAGREGPGLRAD